MYVPRLKVSRPRNNTSIIATSRKIHRRAGTLIGKISILAPLHRQMTISEIKRKKKKRKKEIFYFIIFNHFFFFSYQIIYFSSYHNSLETLKAQLHGATQYLNQKHHVETIFYRFCEPWRKAITYILLIYIYIKLSAITLFFFSFI